MRILGVKSMKSNRAVRPFALNITFLALAIILPINLALARQAAPSEKRVPRGNRAHLQNARWVHPNVTEMQTYDIVAPAPMFSAWSESSNSPALTNGIVTIWKRKSDGLQIRIDVAIFNNGKLAEKAADIRLDELGLAPDPVTRDTVGQGKQKFTEASLDGTALGDTVWSRQISAKEVQQVYLKGRTIVSVIATHDQTVELAEVMRLSKDAATRTK
jgi:hypothetical protein